MCVSRWARSRFWAQVRATNAKTPGTCTEGAEAAPGSLLSTVSGPEGHAHRFAAFPTRAIHMVSMSDHSLCPVDFPPKRARETVGLPLSGMRPHAPWGVAELDVSRWCTRKCPGPVVSESRRNCPFQGERCGDRAAVVSVPVFKSGVATRT